MSPLSARFENQFLHYGDVEALFEYPQHGIRLDSESPFHLLRRNHSFACEWLLALHGIPLQSLRMDPSVSSLRGQNNDPKCRIELVRVLSTKLDI